MRRRRVGTGALRACRAPQHVEHGRRYGGSAARFALDVVCRNICREGERKVRPDLRLGGQLEFRSADEVGLPPEKDFVRRRIRLRLFYGQPHVRLDVHASGVLSGRYSRIYAGSQNPRDILFRGRHVGRVGSRSDVRSARRRFGSELLKAQGPAPQEQCSRPARNAVADMAFRRRGGRGDIYLRQEQRIGFGGRIRSVVRELLRFFRQGHLLRQLGVVDGQRHSPRRGGSIGLSGTRVHQRRDVAGAVAGRVCRCVVPSRQRSHGRETDHLA